MTGQLPELLLRAARDLLACLRFFTRLPLPAMAFETQAHAAPNLTRIGWMAPFAGAIVGILGALTLALAQGLALPHLIGAALAVCALVAVTGALHEDGLADVADGFGGGQTRQRKLEIMRDSRIGAFGGAALCLSLLLRVGALAALLDESLGVACAAVILASAAGRAFALAPLALLDPARADGLGACAGRLEPGVAPQAGLGAFFIAAVAGLFALGLAQAIVACGAALAAALTITALARHQIAGQTGDVAGAAEQVAEILCLVGLLIGHGAP
jgi:adenosylcobinamide-GDP ribazoletransferase